MIVGTIVKKDRIGGLVWIGIGGLILAYKYKMRVARWLHKRMSHNFTQASVTNPYAIKLSTIIRDSGMKEYKKISHSILQVSKALDEMQKHKSIDRYEIAKDTEGRKILDALFKIYVSDSFVSDAKKANQFTNKRLLGKGGSKKNNIPIEDLREELEKDVYGLSETLIINIINKTLAANAHETLDLALKAAKSYMEVLDVQGKDYIPSAITKMAISEGWEPKKATKESKTIEGKGDLFVPTKKEIKIDKKHPFAKKLNKILKEGFDKETYKEVNPNIKPNLHQIL